MYDKPLIMST